MTFKLGLGLGGPASMPVKPYYELDGLQFWMDMNNPEGYALSDTRVIDIFDLSGNNHHFDEVPSSGGQYEATGLNGKPTCNFGGTTGGYRAQHSAFKGFDGLTVIAVLESTITMWAGTYANDLGHLLTIGEHSTQNIEFGSGTGNLPDGGFNFLNRVSGSDDTYSGASARRFRLENGEHTVMGFQTGPQGTRLYRGTNAIALGHYVNDYFTTADADTDFSPAGLGITNDWLGLGYRVTSNLGAGTRRSRFKLSEMLIFNRELSAAEYRAVTLQLQRKWDFPSARSMPAFLIGGQSNAVGQGSAPGAYSTPLGGSEIFEGGHTRVNLVTTKADAANGSSHGIEIPLSRAYKNNYGDNVILKYASGGTSLAVDWKAIAPYGAHLVNALNEWDRTLGYQLAGNGYIPKALGLFWLQGEQDATNEDHANAYEDNLNTFVTFIKDRYGDFPFVIARLSDTLGAGSFPYHDTVIAAQESVAANHDHVFIVNTNNLTLTDGVHYDSDSLIVLGEAMLEAALEREDKTAPTPAP